MEEISEIDAALESNNTEYMNEVYTRLNDRFLMILVNKYLSYLEIYYQYYLLMKKIGANHPREVPENEEVAFFVKKLKSIEEYFLQKVFSNLSSLEILKKTKIFLVDETGYKFFTTEESHNIPDYEKYNFFINILNKKLN
jgi:hypothetical protein